VAVDAPTESADEADARLTSITVRHASRAGIPGRGLARATTVVCGIYLNTKWFFRGAELEAWKRANRKLRLSGRRR
jgi:hypothetical protein